MKYFTLPEGKAAVEGGTISQLDSRPSFFYYDPIFTTDNDFLSIGMSKKALVRHR
jgi:hypothetical protein